MTQRHRLAIFFTGFLLCLGWQVTAQQADAVWQVYLNRNATANQDAVTFINLLTAETSRVLLQGQQYTGYGTELLFFDRANRRASLLAPTGEIRPHPFIQVPPEAQRVDWVISNDQRWIGWTLTTGTPQQLNTRTYVARLDGRDRREVMVDGPRNGIRVQPITFSSDDSALFMDYHPDGLGELTPYEEYAGLFELNLKADGGVSLLPGEPGCFCGAGISGEQFLRLALADDLRGFDIRLYNLRSQGVVTISAPDLPDFTQGGDVLLSPDASRAIYALARIQGFGTVNEQVESVFVFADLTLLRAEVLTAPSPQLLRPVAWTENNAGVLLTSRNEPGTWKLAITDGTLVRVADETYLTTLRLPPGSE